VNYSIKELSSNLSSISGCRCFYISQPRPLLLHIYIYIYIYICLNRQLDSNALVCDCEMMWLSDMLKDGHLQAAVTCDQPSSMAGKQFSQVINDIKCREYLLIIVLLWYDASSFHYSHFLKWIWVIFSILAWLIIIFLLEFHRYYHVVNCHCVAYSDEWFMNEVIDVIALIFLFLINSHLTKKHVFHPLFIL